MWGGSFFFMSLNFHRSIVEEVVGGDDGILVLSRGLGLHKVLQTVLRYYQEELEATICSVFVLNVSPNEQQFIVEELRENGMPLQKLPKRITTDYTAQERYNY
jgi:hypothetical protein